MHGASGRVSGSGGVGALETALLHKNRHLEHEITMARLKVADATQEVDALQAQVQRAGCVVARGAEGRGRRPPHSGSCATAPVASLAMRWP